MTRDTSSQGAVSPGSADEGAARDLVAEALRELLRDRPGGLAVSFSALQADLRRAARAQRAVMGAGETLSTTALVNEAYLKLRRAAPERFNDRRHFVAVAARAMRQVLVDYARERGAAKRGGGLKHETLDPHDGPADDDGLLLDIGDALDRLEAARPRLAQVVYLRYFAGLDDDEIGELLAVDASTVRRDWQKARGWLYAALSP